jgi:hypothetical protein
MAHQASVHVCFLAYDAILLTASLRRPVAHPVLNRVFERADASTGAASSGPTAALCQTRLHDDRILGVLSGLSADPP